MAGLGNAAVMAFVGTRSPDEARTFYRDKLGLRLIQEDNFALMFDAGGTLLRVTKVDRVVNAPYTVLGWRVESAAATIIELKEAGVEFQNFEGMAQDEFGIWEAPGGAKVGWFQDPDGNTLSITEF